MNALTKVKTCLLIVVLAAAVQPVAGGPGEVLPAPQADLRTAANINGVAGAEDGSVFVEGNFWWVNGRPTPGLVKLRADGSVDESFAPRVGVASAWISSFPGSLSVAPQMTALGDGRLLLSSQMDVPESWTVLAADGAEMPGAFPTLPRDRGMRAQFVRDGWLYFIEADVLWMNPTLGRVSVATGQRDTAFAAAHLTTPSGESLPIVRAWPGAMGKIWVTGQKSGSGWTLADGMGSSLAGLGRLLSDGTPDESFATVPLRSGMFISHRMEATPDGGLGVVTSDWSWFAYWPSPTHYPLNVTFYGAEQGAAGFSVHMAAGVGVQTAWQAGGRLLANLTAVYGLLERYDPDGTVDETFTSIPVTGAIFSLPGGDLLRADGSRFTADGVAKPGWTAPVLRRPAACSLVSAAPDDGSVIAVGDWVEADGLPCAPVLRFRADGSRDTAYAPEIGADTAVRAAAAGFGGQVFLVLADAGSRVVRLRSDGALDETFTPYVAEVPSWSGVTVPAIGVDDVRALRDGGALVQIWQRGGDVTFSEWIRLDATGHPQAGSGSTSNRPSGGLVVLRDGRYWIGSRRYGVTGNVELEVANPAWWEDTRPLCELSDGRVVARRGARLVAMRADGSIDESWSAPEHVTVWSAIVAGEAGKCFAATDRGLVRLHRNGRVDATFRPSLAATEAIAPDLVPKALGWQSLQGTGVDFSALLPGTMAYAAGKLWVGGYFTRVGGMRKPAVAALTTGSVAGYAAWAAAAIASEADGSAEADPDGDGMPNGLEWAQACDPLQPDAADGLLRLVSHVPLCFSAGRNPEAPEANPVIEATDDGRTWRVATGSDVLLKSAGSAVQFEALGGAKLRLFRVKFTVPE